MIRWPEPGSFEARLSLIDWPTARLWRFSRSPATEPWFGRGGDGRFDDPAAHADTGAAFGVLYVAEDPETAFCESVIHESGLFRGGAFEVAASTLAERSLVSFRHPRHTALSLVDLCGDALKALGLTNDISAGDDYLAAQQWSKAIHGARPDVDGIRYVSRQRNHRHCFALFERSGLVVDSWAPLNEGDMAVLCTRFNVRRVS